MIEQHLIQKYKFFSLIKRIGSSSADRAYLDAIGLYIFDRIQYHYLQHISYNCYGYKYCYVQDQSLVIRFEICSLSDSITAVKQISIPIIHVCNDLDRWLATTILSQNFELPTDYTKNP